MLDISVNYRYISDISPILRDFFFSIFPRNDFHLQKLCWDGPTPEISTINRRYFTTFLTLGMRNDRYRLEEFLTSSESLSFLSQLLEVVFFSLAILRFLVGLLGEEVNPAEK